MEIFKTEADQVLTFKFKGRLDSVTSPILEAEVENVHKEIQKLVLDFEELAYVSSAGLRIILALQKLMNQQGSMVITHVNETIMEVFEVTGFSDILNIEP